MAENKLKPPTTARLDPKAYQKARIGAVTSKKTIGKWLEEAIIVKEAVGLYTCFRPYLSGLAKET